MNKYLIIFLLLISTIGCSDSENLAIIDSNNSSSSDVISEYMAARDNVHKQIDLTVKTLYLVQGIDINPTTLSTKNSGEMLIKAIESIPPKLRERLISQSDSVINGAVFNTRRDSIFEYATVNLTPAQLQYLVNFTNMYIETGGNNVRQLLHSVRSMPSDAKRYMIIIAAEVDEIMPITKLSGRNPDDYCRNQLLKSIARTLILGEMGSVELAVLEDMLSITGIGSAMDLVRFGLDIGSAIRLYEDYEMCKLKVVN